MDQNNYARGFLQKLMPVQKTALRLLFKVSPHAVGKILKIEDKDIDKFIKTQGNVAKKEELSKKKLTMYSAKRYNTVQLSSELS